MKKIILVAVAGIAMAGVASGQNKLKFRSTEWVGLGSGQVGNALQVQTVNGVYSGPWFVGAGVGLDWYRHISVPLFLSVTRDISLGKKEGLLLFVNGGTNIPLNKRQIPIYNIYDPVTSNVWHDGLYWSAGLGYEWKLGEHTNKAILVSAGYMEKKLTADETQGGGCPIAGPCLRTLPYPVVYEYLNRAYQFMVGFRW